MSISQATPTSRLLRVAEGIQSAQGGLTGTFGTSFSLRAAAESVASQHTFRVVFGICMIRRLGPEHGAAARALSPCTDPMASFGKEFPSATSRPEPRAPFSLHQLISVLAPQLAPVEVAIEDGEERRASPRPSSNSCSLPCCRPCSNLLPPTK